MADLHIREARAADAAAACNVLRRSIIELCEADHGNDPAFLNGWLANKTPENVAAWISDPGNVVLVAIGGAAIAGVASMSKDGRISLNYVSPDARFNGVSKALLTALERKAADLGLAQCRLESTKTARRFYEAAGYREQSGAADGCGANAAESCRPMVKDVAGQSAPGTTNPTLKDLLLGDDARADLAIPARGGTRRRTGERTD
jgi:GNAT superfamily N-acetyltransferase